MFSVGDKDYYCLCSRNEMVGTKARDVDMYKLWYSRGLRKRNGAGMLVVGELRELIEEVRRVNDRMMTIKLAVGGSTLDVISACTENRFGCGGLKSF